MKTIIIPFVVLVLSFVSCKERNTTGGHITLEDAVPQPEAVDGYQCFMDVSEFKDPVSAYIVRDTVMFEMNRKGDSINGSFMLKPQEKDKKSYVFKGVLTGNKANVIARASAEGQTVNEELFFTITDSAVAVKLGEMQQKKDGVWYYKDKNKAEQVVLNRICPNND